jgi:oligopeptide/dipeptide ABC transporter ATP-binding protein
VPSSNPFTEVVPPPPTPPRDRGGEIRSHFAAVSQTTDTLPSSPAPETSLRRDAGESGEAADPQRLARPLLEVEGLKKYFPVRRGLLKRTVAEVKAVDGVSFSLAAGETLCLVGESGCGKSTVGRLILRLIDPTAGTIRLDGEDITKLSRTEMRGRRRRMQIVFQDPYASLNPRLTAGTIVGEPLENFEDITSAERKALVEQLFEKVGLSADAMRRYPFEFSGGQRQRLGLARALALNPAVIVADEPVSALDVSVQAQVLNLMQDLQDELGLAYLFISHDLGIVEHIGHRVAVMYLGRIVEIAEKERLFAAPRHPYTRALMSAAPLPDPRAKRERIVLEGDVPSPMNPPAGCPFHTRCPFAFDRCRVEAPVLREAAPRHRFACHLEG